MWFCTSSYTFSQVNVESIATEVQHPMCLCCKLRKSSNLIQQNKEDMSKMFMTSTRLANDLKKSHLYQNWCNYRLLFLSFSSPTSLTRLWYMLWRNNIVFFMPFLFGRDMEPNMQVCDVIVLWPGSGKYIADRAKMKKSSCILSILDILY